MVFKGGIVSIGLALSFLARRCRTRSEVRSIFFMYYGAMEARNHTFKPTEDGRMMSQTTSTPSQTLQPTPAGVTALTRAPQNVPNPSCPAERLWFLL
jgi:hypothetical protein